MALAENIIETPRFPSDISFGSTSMPKYSTDVSPVVSGVETRNINWSQARHEYDITFGIRNQTYLNALIEYFHAVKGMAYAFRYKDWNDYKSSGTGAITDIDQEFQKTDGIVLLGKQGDGVTTTFQVLKSYTVGTQTNIRWIQKIVNSTLVVAIDGIPTVAYSIDEDTGIITFSSAPLAGEVVTGGYEFDVPVRFSSDELSINMEMYEHGTTNTRLIEVKL